MADAFALLLYLCKGYYYCCMVTTAWLCIWLTLYWADWFQVIRLKFWRGLAISVEIWSIFSLFCQRACQTAIENHSDTYSLAFTEPMKVKVEFNASMSLSFVSHWTWNSLNIHTVFYEMCIQVNVVFWRNNVQIYLFIFIISRCSIIF